MRLNADIGEGFGHWKMGADELIMPLIDDANIACGFHAGDPLVMQKTIALAKTHNVRIGAHVSYPDLQGFGRRSMNIAKEELIAIIHAQIAMLEGMAKCQQLPVSYLKPHGALYNDMMKKPEVLDSVLAALASYHCKMPLVVQALTDNSAQQVMAAKYGVTLLYEGFADRAYQNNGLLVSRQDANAVLSQLQSQEQALLMLNNKALLSITNTEISLKVDTICVHSDTHDALALCAKLRQVINDKR